MHPPLHGGQAVTVLTVGAGLHVTFPSAIGSVGMGDSVQDQINAADAIQVGVVTTVGATTVGKSFSLLL